MIYLIRHGQTQSTPQDGFLRLQAGRVERFGRAALPSGAVAR